MVDRLEKLLVEASEVAANRFRAETLSVLKEKGSFDSKVDREENMYQIEANYLVNRCGVIVPPCKLGETIYMVVSKTHRRTRQVNGETKSIRSKHVFVKTTELTKLNFFDVLERYGKTVFTDKSEADRVCAELRKEINNGR